MTRPFDHPFGILLRAHLDRRGGLTQAALAAGIGQDPAIISDMCHGRRLRGRLARARVLAMLAWLAEIGALVTVAEAQALLAAAGQPPLDGTVSREAEVYACLIAGDLEPALAPPPFAAPDRAAEGGLAALRPAGDAAALAPALLAAGRQALDAGDFPRAAARLSEALGAFEAGGDAQGTAAARLALGRLALEGNRAPLARRHFAAALAAMRAADDRAGVRACLEGLAAVAAAAGDDARAATIWAAAAGLPPGPPRAGADGARQAARRAAARVRLGPAAWAAAWAAGTGLSLADACALALREP